MSTEMTGQIFIPGTILARGRTVFNETNIPSSTYQARIERIQQHLRTKRVNALVVAGEAFDQGSYAYITGNLETLWRPRKTNYTVVPSKGDPIMFTSGGQRELSFLKTQTWITDIRTARQGILDVADGIKSFAAKPTRVGLVGLGQSKRAEAYRALQSQLSGVKFVPLDAFLEKLRRVKDDMEIAQVRRACRALDLEHETLLRNLNAGIKDHEAEAKADRMARLEGARDAKSLWAAGPEGHPVLIPSRERAFTKGDNIAWFATSQWESHQRRWRRCIMQQLEYSKDVLERLNPELTSPSSITRSEEDWRHPAMGRMPRETTASVMRSAWTEPRSHSSTRQLKTLHKMEWFSASESHYIGKRWAPYWWAILYE
jgi:hypothetical protein